MLYTDEIVEYAAETIAINADYARRHGYDLHLVRSELVKKSGAGKDAHAVTLLPHAKMKHIHDAMKVGSPDAPAWVVWLDTDVRPALLQPCPPPCANTQSRVLCAAGHPEP
jgi:hypothetical protein